MTLFQRGSFVLASGQASRFKLVCDALLAEEWATVAEMMRPALGEFGRVEGVPTGGLALADALRPYATAGCGRLLIADDVWTTGGSWERHRANRLAYGAVLFARSDPPLHVKALCRIDC